MKIAITGSGGFLGHHLINFLYENINEEISVYNLGTKNLSKCINYYLDDIIDENQIDMAISSIKPDYLFHLAGTADNSLNSKTIEAVNTTYSSILLKSINKNNLRYHTKILVVGSSAEYGNIKPEDLPVTENHKPKPKTLYAKTKYNQTLDCLSWQQDSGKLVIVRPFNIIGKNMPNYLAIGNFYSQICSITNEGVLKTGRMNVERDFIDVNDVVEIMWKLINNEKAYGQVFNICRGKSLLLSDLVKLMINLSGKKILHIVDQTRFRKEDFHIHYGDNKKLLSIIGEYKFTSWENTIHKIMKV